ncbi:MAG: cobalamin-dependent protein [Candidatus Woesearchaeota archaeon]|nr:cobalamin-dependent protein [Candidatus Woesearchaeota archaeon]
MIKKQTEVILAQPSGEEWQPGSTRGHSTSDAYELALLNQALEDAGIRSDYIVQRPIGTNKEFYQGTKRITPAAPSLEILASDILKRQPKVVGLEVMSCYEANARELARMIKERNPNIKIVVGGYHPSGYPEILNDANGAVDFAVLGAGEKALTFLVQSILTGKNPLEGRSLRVLPKLGDPRRRTAINQSAYAVINNGRIQLVERLEADLIASFGDLNIPKRKMEYQDGSVSGVLARITPDKQIMATMQTRRGCDAGCIYCASSNVYGTNGEKLFSGSNVRSSSNVVRELAYLSGLGVNFIFFTDPTFNEDGRYMGALAEGIIEAKKKGRVSQEMALYAMFRPFSKEQMAKRGLSLSQYSTLKKAGFTRIAFGVENPSDEVLKSFGRNNTLSDSEEHLSMIHDTGMFTRGFMMYGHEGETMESLSKYSEIMKNLHVDEWRLAPMTPFVGTSTGDAYLARQTSIDFSKHDANCPVIIPDAIRACYDHEGSYAEDEARAFLMNWKKSTLKSIYCSDEWKKRMNEKHRRFPELREGIEFYYRYLQENLGERFGN